MSGEVVILRFGRHSQSWRQQVLASPPALRAREEGVILEPDWANGAKILASRISSADLIRSRAELHPFHVILLQDDVPELEEWLRQHLSYRQRPRANQEQVDATIQRLDYVVENTFVRSSTSAGRSLSTCTASTQGYGEKNPRKWRPSLPSVATVGSQHSESKNLWEHAGEMKKRQGQRDIHGVLQCMSNIKRDGLVPDTYCYNMVINLFGKLEKVEEAERWFTQMESDGVRPDAMTFAVLMDAYGIAKSLDKMKGCLDEMDRRDLEPSISHFSIIISAYARKKDYKNAEAQFQELLNRGLAPEEATFGALINMYAQAGQPKNAKEKLEQKTTRFHLLLNKIDCSVMANAHANASHEHPWHVDEAVKWHNKLKALFPDDVKIYDYTVIFKACARARPKRCDIACQLFRELLEAGIGPDHFNIVTLRSAAGSREQAQVVEDLIEEFGVDTRRLKEQFQAFGEEYNFDERLNRKLWKLQGVEA